MIRSSSGLGEGAVSIMVGGEVVTVNQLVQLLWSDGDPRTG
jgi:hypothetical protein